MKRRSFFGKLAAASLGFGLGNSGTLQAGSWKPDRIQEKSTFSVNDNQISFHIKDWGDSLKIMHITDTHLWMDDDRGIPFQTYSNRMAKAYNVTRHFRTGEETNPVKAMEETLALAKEKNVDFLTLVGDIFSFPSEAAIEWMGQKLEEAGIPYLYSAGNHDWHYEGMEGSLKDLRDTWIEKRLKPLYQGHDPLMASFQVKGMNIVAIDNSYYEIIPDQLDFFREQVRKGGPMVLMMHIPLYAPGRSTGYGCGNPNWNASSDRNHELERRPKWPESGHSKVTMDFYREVWNAPNLLGVFAGHIHRQTIDIINGIPQFLPNPNATGAYLEVDFVSMAARDAEVVPGK